MLGLSCSTACRIFLDQKSNLFPASADGLSSIVPPGSPHPGIFNKNSFTHDSLGKSISQLTGKIGDNFRLSNLGKLLSSFLHI